MLSSNARKVHSVQVALDPWTVGRRLGSSVYDSYPRRTDTNHGFHHGDVLESQGTRNFGDNIAISEVYVPNCIGYTRLYIISLIDFCFQVPDWIRFRNCFDLPTHSYQMTLDNHPRKSRDERRLSHKNIIEPHEILSIAYVSVFDDARTEPANIPIHS